MKSETYKGNNQNYRKADNCDNPMRKFVSAFVGRKPFVVNMLVGAIKHHELSASLMELSNLESQVLTAKQ
jgi:hypothetical protein